jgi:predicted ArsR family transcriptional regulator
MDEVLARAVIEPRRRQILDALRSRRDGFWTVDEVAAKEGVHRTVAFEHLEALAAAGLLDRRKLVGARGRPANVYRYAGAVVELTYPPQKNRLLAELLARSLASSPSGVGEAHRVGREFGAGVDDLQLLGGDYELDERSVHARTCIFEAACAGARDVVCGLHAGLIEGALGAHGPACTVVPAGPDGWGGCVFAVEADPIGTKGEEAI